MLKTFMLASLLIVFMLVIRTGDSFAGDGGFLLTPEARPILEKGLAAAKSQDYRLAVRIFEEGRKYSPNAPELLFNLGLAESKIPGREIAAIVWFKAFLAVKPNAPEAPKILALCSELRTTAIANLRKVIALDKQVAGKLTEGMERDSVFHSISMIEARLGFFDDSIATAQMAGRYNTSAISNTVIYKTENGDVNGALRIAEQSGRQHYRVIALYQAQIDSAENVLSTMEAARQFGNWDDWDTMMVMSAFAKRGDINGIRKIGEFAVNKSQLNRFIAEAQANRGDIAGAMKTVLLLDKYNRGSVYERIAEIEAKKGDIRSAMATAKIAGDSKNKIYINIAEIQAMRGDLKGAKRTLSLVPGADMNSVIKTKIEIAQSLSKISGVQKLRERTTVLYEYSWIMQDLNSPNYPWLKDPLSYLDHLSSIDDPKIITERVHNLLFGVPEMGALRGGTFQMFEQVDRLGTRPNY